MIDASRAWLFLTGFEQAAAATHSPKASARRAINDYIRLAVNQAEDVREQNIHRMTGLTLVAEGKGEAAIAELRAARIVARAIVPAPHFRDSPCHQ